MRYSKAPISGFKPSLAVVAALAMILLGNTSAAESVTLAQALATALDHNPELRASRFVATSAAAQGDLAASAARPRVNAALSYRYLDPPTLFFGEEVFKTTTQTQMLAVSLPLHDRSIGLTRRAADLAAEAALASADGVAELLVIEVAERYWSVVAAREQVAAAEDAVRFLEANLGRTRASQEGGAATKGDVLRVEAELALARDRLLSARNGVKIALAALKLSMGVDQSSEVDVPEQELTPDPRVLAAEPRPSASVLAAEAAFQAATASVSAARAADDPRLSLDADVQSVPQGAEFPRRDGSFSAMVNLSMPLFDGGATRARVDAASAEAARAESQLLQARALRAFQEKSTHLALESAYERHNATSRQVESALESRRLTDIGAAEGIYTQTDLLSAQHAVTSAQTSRIQSMVDLKIAEARRLAAIGRTDALLDQ